MENNPDPGIEATKIISHQRKTERWPLNICSHTLVASRHRLVVYIFGGNDLLQKLGE
jgi:hypothetical protein